MRNHSQRSAKSAASTRRGAGFLLLVMMILLVIVSATQWLLTGTVANRKGENARLRARTMIAAIQQAQNVASDRQATLRLPVDETRNERIEVVASEDESSLTAIWLRGNTEIARLIRSVKTLPDPAESADKLVQESDKQ